LSSSREIDKRKSEPWTQTNFGGGMIRNAPHDDLPLDAVADLINAHAFPTEIQPRGAAWLWSDLQPPALEGRTGYSASQEGNIITSESGDIFSEADVSNFWVWPDDPDNFHVEIQEYISATQVRIGGNQDRDTTSGCWMHGRLNHFGWQKHLRRLVFQWGEKFYTPDSISLNSWNPVIIVSYDEPNNVISDGDDMIDYRVLFNSNGIFVLDFEPSVPLAFKKNTSVPTVLVLDRIRTAERPIRQAYTYSVARLSGHGFRNRGTRDIKLLQESGTTALVETEVAEKDYGDRWIERRIGTGNQSSGRLIGGVMAAAQRDPSYWNGLAAPGFSFTLPINGRPEGFLIDAGAAGYDVQNMGQLSDAIQETVRLQFPFFTSEYDENGRFIFTSGREDGSIIDYVTAGVGGTDVSALMMLTDVTAQSLDNTYGIEAPHTVESLHMPVVFGTTIPEWHWTHYPVYRSGDIGPLGINPRVTDEDEVRPPVTFSWAMDLRVSGAFYAYKQEDSLVVALKGTFEVEDEGTPFEWEDGEIDTIYQVVSDTTAYMRAVGEGEAYPEIAKKLQAAAIGGGRVIRASQTGDIVTIESEYNADVIGTDDIRKTITWSNQFYSIVREVLSARTFRVWDTLPRETQGFTLDATWRNFTDRVPDETLRDRAGERHVGLLDHRFWRAMPNVNIGRVVPGFMITAQKNRSDIHYCQLGVRSTYLSGYHLPNRQVLDRVQGSIQAMRKVPDHFIVWCIDSTWAGPTNNPNIKYLPEFGEAYAVLSIDVKDEEIGLVDIGSLREVDFGTFQMRCSDGSWRQFNGRKYTQDTSVIEETGQDLSLIHI